MACTCYLLLLDLLKRHRISSGGIQPTTQVTSQKTVATKIKVSVLLEKSRTHIP